MTALRLRSRRAAAEPSADRQHQRTKTLPRVDVLINNAGIGQAALWKTCRSTLPESCLRSMYLDQWN
jgi:NAD(P)-dependent dehydrogenase (short-subunit alcohol dehydrogenase family)